MRAADYCGVEHERWPLTTVPADRTQRHKRPSLMIATALSAAAVRPTQGYATLPTPRHPRHRGADSASLLSYDIAVSTMVAGTNICD